MAHTCSREELEKKFPWLAQYRTKKWQTYELVFTGEEHRALQAKMCTNMEACGIMVCGAGSGYSVSHVQRNGSVNNLFFFDLEQTEGMGLGECFHPEYGFLTSEWRGHPRGSIVLISANGLYELGEGGERKGLKVPPTCLVGIAPYAPTKEDDAEAIKVAYEELSKGVSEDEVTTLLYGAGDYSTHQARQIVHIATQSLAKKSDPVAR